MYPVVWTIPFLNIEVPGYGVALMIAFLVASMWASRRAERSGANPDVVLNCAFIALFGGVLGARAMYVLHYWNELVTASTVTGKLWQIINFRRGGLEVYGGVIVVTILVLVYLWRYKHSIRWYLDIMAPSAALGMAIGRVGCLLNGCCFGGVCDLPWAVQFPYGSPPALKQWLDHEPGAGLPVELVYFTPGGMHLGGSAAAPITRESLRATDKQLSKLVEAGRRAAEPLRARAARATDPAERQKLLTMAELAELADGDYGDLRAQMRKHNLTAAQMRERAAGFRSLPVHPTQLYSTVALGLLAMLLVTLYWRRTRDGQVICVLLLVEPVTRWVIEVIRADNPVDTLGAFTISQFLALTLSAVGLAGLFLLRYLPARSPRAVPWSPPPDPPVTRKR